MTDPDPRRPVPEELSELDVQLRDVPQRVQRRIEPGGRALVVASAVLVLLIGATLPWTESLSGWEVFGGHGQASGLPRLFAWTAIGFGVIGSALALTTRRWFLAWVCALGCGFSILAGVLAIWSRQTGAVPGPGIGLVVALLAIVVLTATWVRLAWSRG